MTKKRTLKSIWFTSFQGFTVKIGIVIINCDNEEEAYIGTGSGLNIKADEETIAEWGAPFPIEIAKQLICIRPDDIKREVKDNEV